MPRFDTWNSIVFTVPPAATAQIRRYQQEVNQQLIAGEIAQKGKARVTRLGQNDRVTTVSYVPVLGEAEPLVGDFGGLYTFTFGPSSTSCVLEVTAAEIAFKRVGIAPASPLKIELSGETVASGMRTPRHELDWSGPELNSDEDLYFVHEVTLDELEFPIDGTMYQRLVDWGWDPLQFEAYHYIFVPLSVGCEMAVVHLPSEQEVHLTKDVGW